MPQEQEYNHTLLQSFWKWRQVVTRAFRVAVIIQFFWKKSGWRPEFFEKKTGWVHKKLKHYFALERVYLGEYMIFFNGKTCNDLHLSWYASYFLGPSYNFVFIIFVIIIRQIQLSLCCASNTDSGTLYIEILKIVSMLIQALYKWSASQIQSNSRFPVEKYHLFAKIHMFKCKIMF